jgi:hypothetical protein
MLPLNAMLRRRATIVVYVAALSVASSLPSLLQAQGLGTSGRRLESQAGRVQADCRLRLAALDRLTSGTENDSTLRDARQIAECEHSGPPALSRAWQANRAISHKALITLIDASVNLRDRRIEATITEILLDPGQPSLLRQGAALVLASYVDPSLRGDIQPSVYKNEEAALGMGHVDHTDPNVGDMPIAPGVKARVLATYERLGPLTTAPALRDLVRALRADIAQK